MRDTPWKNWLSLFIPGGLIVLLAVGFLRPLGLPSWLQPPIAALPYIVLTFGLVFGWYFTHIRMILSLLALTLADRVIALFPITGNSPDIINQTIFALTAFLLPLNLLGFSLFKEDSASMIARAMQLLALLCQPFLVLWLSKPEQEQIAAIFQLRYLDWLPPGWTAIPQAALIMWVSAWLLLLARDVIRRDPFDHGSTWAVAAAFVAFHGHGLGWQATSFFSTAGLILFVTLMQSSYQRTYRDELTGIGGPLAYEEATAHLGKQFSLAILSIDQLNSYTRSYGKSVFEQLLKSVAPIVQAACATGRVFRISGEELTLLFTNRSALDTLAALEQIRKTVEASAYVLRGQDRVREERGNSKKPGAQDRPLPLTVSIGVAGKSDEAATLSLVVKTAYRALYDAKAAGGNIVKRGTVVSEPPKRSRGYNGKIVTSGDY